MFGTRTQDVENVTQERRQPERQKVVAERINGQLAMLGLVIGTINYGLFGWIAPGLF